MNYSTSPVLNHNQIIPDYQLKYTYVAIGRNPGMTDACGYIFVFLGQLDNALSNHGSTMAK